MEKFYHKSPVGILEIVCENDVLISLKIVEEFQISNSETIFCQKIKKQLDEYFVGKRTFFDIEVRLQGTDFQKRVWNELIKIPYGETKSYSQIAENAGNKNAQRAVGSACNKNPVMIIVPCHRVIAKNGSLGGFAYGNNIKQKLLDLEKIN